MKFDLSSLAVDVIFLFFFYSLIYVAVGLISSINSDSKCNTIEGLACVFCEYMCNIPTIFTSIYLILGFLALLSIVYLFIFRSNNFV